MPVFRGSTDTDVASGLMTMDRIIEIYTIVNTGNTPVTVNVGISTQRDGVIAIMPKDMLINPSDAVADRRVVIQQGDKIDLKVKNGKVDYYFSML